MQVLPHQQNADALRILTCAGLDLLTSSQFAMLVEFYSYASALGRDPLEAIRSDLAKALLDASGSELLPVKPSELSVVFYQENTSFLRAAIDCKMPTLGGRYVWISFVVTANKTEQILTLEDISAEAESEQCGKDR